MTNKIHVCNLAANLLLFGMYHELGASWEDNGLDSLERADQLFEFIEGENPDAFLMIETGDYIIPDPCLNKTLNLLAFGRWHHECETYDPYYRKLLVHRSYWETIKDKVLSVDFNWRTRASYCFDVLRETDYWWWLDDNDYPRESQP